MRSRAGSHGGDDVGVERLLAARGHADPELVRRSLGASEIDVPERDLVPAGAKRPCHRLPVHAGAHHGRATWIGTTEGLRSEHGGGARADRGDGGRVEHRTQRPVGRVGDDDEAGDRRQAVRRIPWKRRHPLEQRVSGPERRHRTEVTCRVRRHVHLRRHRPLAAGVRLECLAHGLDGPLGRHRSLDLASCEHGDHGAGSLVGTEPVQWARGVRRRRGRVRPVHGPVLDVARAAARGSRRCDSGPARARRRVRAGRAHRRADRPGGVRTPSRLSTRPSRSSRRSGSVSRRSRSSERPRRTCRSRTERSTRRCCSSSCTSSATRSPGSARWPA